MHGKGWSWGHIQETWNQLLQTPCLVPGAQGLTGNPETKDSPRPMHGEADAEEGQTL